MTAVEHMELVDDAERTEALIHRPRVLRRDELVVGKADHHNPDLACCGDERGSAS